MECDICFVCHRQINFKDLDDAYPHLTEGPDHFPPEGMSLLEEDIYWGLICLDCARSAEKEPPEGTAAYPAKQPQSNLFILKQAAPGPGEAVES